MKFYRQLSIQTKLIGVFMITSFISFCVTMFMHVNINQALDVIDQVYTSNAQLNQVAEALEGIQLSVREYLDTKSTESLNQYYAKEQQYSTLLNSLNTKILDNDSAIMEKNIRGISETYLELAKEAVEAKRARNVSKYRVEFDGATNLFNYLNAYLFSLNNEQFKENSTNYSTLAHSLKMLEQITVLVNIGVALFNVLLIILLTRQITKPLKILSVSANEVAKGHFELPDLEIRTEDEVGNVTKAFNKMVSSLREYILRVKESMEAENEAKERELLMKTHLKDAQLKYYQAQIHPHFLFNTLNAGAQLAMLEDAEKTSSFIQKMSEFFRYSMNGLSKDVELGDEVELVESYLYIMNVRFSGEILFEKRISNDIEGIRVPSMILQPIVENAVQYGIRNIDWEGKIILSIEEAQECYLICIKDNGIGIEKEKLEKIRHGNARSEDSDTSNGIGLENVVERLTLYYQRTDLFTLESEGKNQGTRVTIQIPKRTGELNV